MTGPFGQVLARLRWTRRTLARAGEGEAMDRLSTQTSCTGCTGCSGGNARCVCHRPRKRAALLINLGTPDSTSVADVRRYLREFLADPFVIKLPGVWRHFTPALAAMIAHFRGPKSAHAYKTIWSDEGSPLRVITERQQAKLRERLGGGWEVCYAMRYGSPSIRDVVAKLAADEVTEVVVVPMYPQWAGPTTGTALEVLYRELRVQGLRFNLTVRTEWYDDRAYIEAQAMLINRFIAERGLAPETAFLLFSTHSMPQSYIRDGDPYEGQIRRTMELVRRRIGWPEERCDLSFQSKLGPVAWLSPSTEDTVAKLAGRGEKNLVVCPISFTADCLETVEEIGVQYARLFQERSGGGTLHLAPSLNDDEEFIKALASLVRKGATSMDAAQPITPLCTSSKVESLKALIDRLVMVGVAKPGRLEHQAEMDFVDDECLRSLRRERTDLFECVKACRAQPHIDGCFVFNTCQRSELYALTDHGGAADRVIPGLRTGFFAHAGAGVEPVALKGRDAYRRLLKTSLGLNSTLPGDSDVMEQLRSARMMAEHAETLSPGLSRLLDEVERAAGSIREETAWGGYMSDFAAAAMASLDLRWDPARQEGVIIGGSTTSRQLLRIFTEGRPEESDKLTLVYRGTARKDLIKFVRQVAPHARRLRVDRYDDAEVVQAIAHADTIFLGIDAREPVLRREHLEGLRDFSKRGLTVVDFNSFGSTVGLEGLAGVRLIPADRLGQAAAEYGERQIAKAGFSDAFDEARRFVEATACAAGWDPVKHECVKGSCDRCGGAGCHTNGAVNGKAHGAACAEGRKETVVCLNYQ
jgi:ferrochelatase